MEQEILNIIYSYTFANKLLDKKAIFEIIKILRKEYSLSKEVKSIYISEKKNLNFVGLYDPNMNALLLFLYNIKNNEVYNIEFKNRPERIFYKNIIILRAILHELRHAYQNSLKGKERKIVEYAWNFTYNQKEYLKVCKLNPNERDAEFSSFYKIIKLLKENDKIFPETLECLKWYLYHKMQIGYTYKDNIVTGTPLKKFCKMTSAPKLMYRDTLSLFDNSSFYKRVSFGLPITYEELTDINRKEAISTFKLKNS